jgi:hypothetical protein
MRHVPGRYLCRYDGEEMTATKQSRYIFGEAERQMVQKGEKKMKLLTTHT